MRATFTPVERFRKVGGRVQLRYGDLAVLSEMTGKSVGHLSRLIGGHRQSDALAAEVEKIVGVPLAKIDPPRKRQAA